MTTDTLRTTARRDPYTLLAAVRKLAREVGIDVGDADTAAREAGVWDETQHPRDDRGRWTDAGGGLLSPPVAGIGAEGFKVLSIQDTRAYEEGPDDKWHPVPGSGSAHDCDRCGKEHEVYFHVRDRATGDTFTVGGRCAVTAGVFTERQQRSVGAVAKRVASLEAQIKGLERDAELIARVSAEVDALPVPPIEETTEHHPAWTSSDGKAHPAEDVPVLRAGDATVKTRFADLTKPAERTERTQAVLDSWRKKRLRERLGPKKQSLVYSEILTGEIAAVRQQHAKATRRLNDLLGAEGLREGSRIWQDRFAEALAAEHAVEGWRERLAREAGFDPDQPRDESGRWALGAEGRFWARARDVARAHGGAEQEFGILVPKQPGRVKAALVALVQRLRATMGPIPADSSGGRLVRTAPGRREFLNTARTVPELVVDAKATLGDFRRMLGSIAADTGGEAMYGPNNAFALKSRDSIQAKVDKRVNTVFRGDEELAVQSISDALRGTLIVDTPEQFGNAVRGIDAGIRRTGGFYRWQDKTEDYAQRTENGYVAIHADAYLPVAGQAGRWVRAEIQLHLRAINDGTPTTPKELVWKRTYKGGAALSPARRNAASMLMFLTGLRSVFPGG